MPDNTTYVERKDFWKKVYVMAIRNGWGSTAAKSASDEAVLALRERFDAKV